MISECELENEKALGTFDYGPGFTSPIGTWLQHTALSPLLSCRGKLSSGREDPRARASSSSPSLIPRWWRGRKLGDVHMYVCMYVCMYVPIHTTYVCMYIYISHG
jgi:hypothetical protein